MYQYLRLKGPLTFRCNPPRRDRDLSACECQLESQDRGIVDTTHPVRFSCPPKCLNRVISRSALLARMTLSNTRVMHLTATGSPERLSWTEMTRP